MTDHRHYHEAPRLSEDDCRNRGRVYLGGICERPFSRLGRNYIEVGKLTEEFFPLHDVRLYVSDGVDSDEGEDDFTPFKNIMNEYYAKDISSADRQ